MLLEIKQNSIYFPPMNINKAVFYNKRFYDIVSTSKNALSLSIQWNRWQVISIIALTIVSTLVIVWTAYHYRHHGDRFKNNQKLDNKDEKLNHPPQETLIKPEQKKEEDKNLNPSPQETIKEPAQDPEQNKDKSTSQEKIGLKKYRFSVIDFKELPYKQILDNAKYKEHAVPVLIHLLTLTEFNKEKLPEIDLFLAKTEISPDRFSTDAGIIEEYLKKWMQQEGNHEDLDKKLLDRVGKFAYHGTSEAHLPGISEHGLSPNKRVFDVSLLERITSIFRQQKIHFLAFNAGGMGGHKDNERICVTGLAHNAVKYAIRSPEWFREAVGVQDLKKANIPQMIDNFKKKMGQLKDLTHEDENMMLDFIKTEAKKYVDQRPAVIVVKDNNKNFSYLEKIIYRIPKYSMPMEAMIIPQYKEGLDHWNQDTQSRFAHLSKNVEIENVIFI